MPRPLPPVDGGEHMAVPGTACPECWGPATAITIDAGKFAFDPDPAVARPDRTIHPCGHVIGDHWEHCTFLVKDTVVTEWQPR